MLEAHLTKLGVREIVSPAEEAAIRGAVSSVRRFSANCVIARAGEPRDQSLLIVDGWLARAKHPLGYERQITGVRIPGDFADLHGLVLGRLDHDLIALTECEVAVLPHARLEMLLSRSPHIARIYRIMSHIDSAIEREWSASLGRRSRAAHLAHLFCEIFLRLESVGRTAGATCEFPLTQNHLADCLGATPVHVNRVLQELRGRGMIKLEHRRLTIMDHEALRTLAKFEPGYLFMEPVMPRSSLMVECERVAPHGHATSAAQTCGSELFVPS